MRRVRTCILLFLLLSILSFGQQPQDTATNSAQVRSAPPLRVNVDLVLLQTTVTDSNNRYVTGLGRQDFKVWEDKIEQQIDYFSTENVPLSVGIIFDVSGSMAT